MAPADSQPTENQSWYQLEQLHRYHCKIIAVVNSATASLAIRMTSALSSAPMLISFTDPTSPPRSTGQHSLGIAGDLAVSAVARKFGLNSGVKDARLSVLF
jgi:hypothetical protein